MAADESAAIVTRDLVKRYGPTLAVDHLSLQIRHGEVFGLLGPNGAGKTTTILMLLGLSEPTSGDALVLGLDPTRSPLEIKRQVGYLPDNVGFYDDLTGRENLRYTARLNGLRGPDVETRLGELLEQVGIAYAADRPAGEYSRGMRQRLGIADALVKEPRVIILDEPTIAIDPEGVQEILQLIRWLADDRGVTVLLSSHLLQQVQAICDRVGIFVEGRLIAVGAVSELAERFAPESVVVEVGVAGDPDTIRSVLRALPGVRTVERMERDPRIWIIDAESDPRLALTQRLLANDLVLLSLRRRGEALDELYHRWFAGDRGGPMEVEHGVAG